MSLRSVWYWQIFLRSHQPNQDLFLYSGVKQGRGSRGHEAGGQEPAGKVEDERGMRGRRREGRKLTSLEVVRAGRNSKKKCNIVLCFAIKNYTKKGRKGRAVFVAFSISFPPGCMGC